jgi:flagellar FliL protein
MADEVAEAAADPPKKGPGMMTLIKAVAFVSIIVLLQITAASMIIPSAEETTEIANELANADLQEESDADSSEENAGKEEDLLLATQEMTEVPLGTYHVLSYNPDSGSKTNVDFKLFATVLADEEGEFFDLFTANEQRIREQVLVTLRGTEIADLTDPTLGLIKRKVLEKTNRALGKPLLHEAIFSDFSFEER